MNPTLLLTLIIIATILFIILLIIVVCCYKGYEKRKANSNIVLPLPIDEKTGEIKKAPTLFVDRGNTGAMPLEKNNTFGGTPPLGK